jgi:hypothetical protein
VIALLRSRNMFWGAPTNTHWGKSSKSSRQAFAHCLTFKPKLVSVCAKKQSFVAGCTHIPGKCRCPLYVLILPPGSGIDPMRWYYKLSVLSIDRNQALSYRFRRTPPPQHYFWAPTFFARVREPRLEQTICLSKPSFLRTAV